MKNNTVRLFFTNYHLISEKGFEEFKREQRKLFAEDLITLVSDPRGEFTYHGKDGFFEGMIAWSQNFFVNGKSRHDYWVETPTHVLVKMLSELRLLKAINGGYVSDEAGHDWHQEFELSDGLIKVCKISLHFF
jgi:hypothetical protein